MFCVACGKEAKIGNLCEDCFTDKKRIFSLEDFRFEICSSCGSFFDKSWQYSRPVDEIIDLMIARRMERLGKIRSVNVEKKRVGNTMLTTVTCIGNIPPASKIKTEKRTIRIKMINMKCDNCTKVLGGYYEAVIQLRGKDAKKLAEKINSGVLKETKDGYDIKFVKKSDAKRIAKSLEKNYSVKKSFTFVTEKKGKKLYRNYYAVR